MKFPRFWEHRQATATDYTAAVLAVLSANAAGGTLRGTAAAVEIAVGAWGRGLAAATVSPVNRRTAALTASTLAYIGRGLCKNGEVVFALDIQGGQITLKPVQSWVVAGGMDRDDWVYDCTFQTPSGSFVRTLPSARVLHLMYAESPSQPWTAEGPLSAIGLTQSMVLSMERALAEEAGTATAYVVPVPDPKQAGALTSDLRQARGSLNLVPSTKSDAAWGMGQESAPGSDWQSMRLGMMPPMSMVELRSRGELSILAACGVPVTILSLSDGTAKQKDFARFLTLTMVPLGKIIAQQIGDALDIDGLSFDFNDLGAADIAAKGRVFGQLVSNGVSIADAADVAGLPISDTTPTPAPAPGPVNDN